MKMHKLPPTLLLAMMARSLVAAVAAGLVLLVPAPALASANPSPPLGTVLAEPVARGFVELPAGQGPVEGAVTLDDIASAGTNPSQDRTTLKQDGFVAAYGRTWVDNANQHELQELVMAFSGGAGAERWLQTSKKTDTGNQYFMHGISVAGIGTYYGAHLADPRRSAYADIIGLVKGNDYFFIASLSVNDDLDAPTATQAKGQYDFAPSSTIPPTQWPEHGVGALSRLGDLATTYGPYAAGIAVLAILVTFAVVLIRRRRRAALSLGDVHMSPDGTYWWDGRDWRDAAKEAPPGALRSSDGYYWWDGRIWRLMPEPPSPPVELQPTSGL